MNSGKFLGACSASFRFVDQQRERGGNPNGCNLINLGHCAVVQRSTVIGLLWSILHKSEMNYVTGTLGCGWRPATKKGASVRMRPLSVIERRLVAIGIRLVRARLRDGDVVGLLGRKLGQLHAD